jgi:hypothetical protein
MPHETNCVEIFQTKKEDPKVSRKQQNNSHNTLTIIISRE